MRVLVASDRVGGGLPAPLAAAAIRDGWTRAAPSDRVSTCALSDGGPGFVAALHTSTGGDLLAATVRSAAGSDVPAAVLLVTDGAGGRTAYVEQAQATGHAVVPGGTVDRGAATSAGVGQLLALARASGARRVVVGVGAARCHDAGAGMLAALGVGAGLGGPLGDGVRGLAGVREDDLHGLRELRAAWAGIDLVAAVDSDGPLLGLHGASATSAARGEVPGDEAQAMERGVAHVAHLALSVLGPHETRRDLQAARATSQTRLTALPGTGAGGGLGFGLALLGARLLRGPDVVAEVVGLRGRAAEADVVVTGTATLDPMTLDASVVRTVATAALPAAVPTVVVAGEVLVGRRELAAAGFAAAYAVRDTPDGEAAWAVDAAGALARRAERVARTWSR